MGASVGAESLWERVRAREEEDKERLEVANELANAPRGVGKFSEAVQMCRDILEVEQARVRPGGPEHVGIGR